ncbi:MAG: hypothetical protein IJD22_00520, partial [Clostridia bacterium]|nr:hypothetical protein [Clostridia bacterium]
MEKEKTRLRKGLLIIGAAVGLLLLLMPMLFKSEEKAVSEESFEPEYYSELLEKKLEELLA